MRVRHPLVFSGNQNCTLSCSVCVFAVWRACTAPSRVQWYPKTAPSRVQCVFLLPAAYTNPSKRETKKASPYVSILLFEHINMFSAPKAHNEKYCRRTCILVSPLVKLSSHVRWAIDGKLALSGAFSCFKYDLHRREEIGSTQLLWKVAKRLS